MRHPHRRLGLTELFRSSAHWKAPVCLHPVGRETDCDATLPTPRTKVVSTHVRHGWARLGPAFSHPRVIKRAHRSLSQAGPQ